MPFRLPLSFFHRLDSVPVAAAYLFLVRSMRYLALVLATAAQLAAATPDISPTPPVIKIPPDAKKARALALSAPRPKYPVEARHHHWTGVGWYLMIVDVDTGLVTSVRVLQGSGHEVLDHAATEAFSHWRFKPHTVSKVKTPVTWGLSS
jgi:TonB family protein